jgi:hypothetical protein
VTLLRASTPLLLVVFGLACASPGPSLTPASPTTAADVEDQGRSPRGAITLHPIAVREGNLELGSADGHAYLLIDNEPVPLMPGRAPQRRPELARGLTPSHSAFMSRTVIAVGGQLERGPAYLVTREDMERAGSHFETLVYDREGWRPLTLDHGAMQGYYQAILSLPGDVILGLRRFEFGFGEMPDFAYEDSPESEAYWAELEAERRAAQVGFEILAGSPRQVPELPPGWITTDAVATTDGRVVALGHQPTPDDESDDAGWIPPTQLLDWAPGQARPEIRSLPGLDPETPPYSARLWSAGEQVIASAWASPRMIDTSPEQRRPYLAVGRGEAWTSIPVESLELDEFERVISSATLDDAGELWVTVGSAYFDPEAEATRPTLWRQSSGAWLPVALPAVGGEAWASRPRWFYASSEERWFELGPADDELGSNPVATQVRWADGELWVVAKLGRVYPEIDEIWVQETRSVVYASRPVELAPLLPSYDQIERERIDAQASSLAPGQPGCERFTVVLADRPSADRRAAILTRASALASPPATDSGNAQALYLGALLDDPGHTQLVYDAHAWSPTEAAKLLATIGGALGVQVQADCRPRAMVEMLVP